MSVVILTVKFFSIKFLANAYAGTQVERTDVVTAEDTVAAATSNAVAAVKFNRVTWLG